MTVQLNTAQSTGTQAQDAPQHTRKVLVVACRNARSKGLPVESAIVGAPDAVAAAMDAANFTDFDEVLVASTRPHRVMARMGLSLAARIQRATGLPVEHVVSAPARRPV